MKNSFNKYILLFLTFYIVSCSKEKFAEYNTDPDAVIDVPVDYLFTRAIIATNDNDFEAYYDNYSYVSRWSRVFLQRTGNSGTVADNAANANNRYGRFYNDIGPLLTDVQQVIDKMPEEQKIRNNYKKAIAKILKAQQAFYVSDVNGSIPYTEAFQSRYGGTLRPKYDTQEQLFEIIDNELKDAATTLSTDQSVEQFSYGNADLYFKGDAKKWAKAANSYRLVLALRILKRKPEQAKAIITDVLQSPAGLIANESEDWALIARKDFTAGGNWNITGNGRAFVGEHGVIEYMWNNEDPRLRFFFRPNQWSTENFELAKAQGKINNSAIYDQRRYYGQFSDPSAGNDPVKARFLNPITIKQGENNIALDTVSRIQDRIFQPENNNGTGVGIFPILTYAELCFIRAEIAQRGLSNENAENLYYEGIEASLKFYNKLGELAKIYEYTALTQSEIEAFKQKSDIAFKSSTGLEQIILQAYLNYFRNFNEAWALIKRTGMPNKNTKLVFEDWNDESQPLSMPRRFVISFPLITDYNYENKKQALDDMVKDPEFGDASNIQGRVWWDKK